MGRGKGVRPASGSSIEIDFYYRGVRCRERLKLKPTPKNRSYAERLKGEIVNAIEKGVFDYAKTFPNSPRARMFAKVAGDTITVAEALEAWLPRAQDGVEASTFLDYQKSVRNILIPEFGGLLLTELTRGAVRDWISELDVSRKRVTNLLIPLRGTLEDALEDGQIEHDPLHGWSPKKKDSHAEEDVIDPFAPDEMGAIITALPDQAANLAQFGFWTGLRTSELFAVRWGDINWSRQSLFISRARVVGKIKGPKTRAGKREVKLLPPALEAVERQKVHTYLIGEEIFHNPRTNEPWAGDGAFRKTAWRHAVRRAGVRYRYPYQMRHTYASMMLSAGENPVWVANQMGHKDWSMIIRTYGRWIPQVDPDAGSKIISKLGQWSALGQYQSVTD